MGQNPLGDGVVAAWIPGVASADSLDRQPAAPEQPIAFDRCYRICGACRREATRRRKRGRDEPLVEPHERHGNPPRHHDNFAPSHGRTPTRIKTVDRAASRSCAAASAVPGRAMTITSYPGQGPAALRTASRRTRRERFRSTAPPSLLPATKATRPLGPRPSGVGAASTVTSGLAALRALRKIPSISREDRMVAISDPSSRRLGAQNLAALAAASGENSSAASSCHTSSEAMCLGALPDIRLIRTVHFSS
jgi:hypothetical protein